MKIKFSHKGESIQIELSQEMTEVIIRQNKQDKKFNPSATLPESAKDIFLAAVEHDAKWWAIDKEFEEADNEEN